MRLDRISGTPTVSTAQVTGPSQGGQAGELRTEEPRSGAPVQEQDPRLVERAVERMNDILKHTNNNMLEFQLDDKHRVVIKVIDRNTNEVVDQIPSERLLKVLQSMDELLGNLLDTKA